MAERCTKAYGFTESLTHYSHMNSWNVVWDMYIVYSVYNVHAHTHTDIMIQLYPQPHELPEGSKLRAYGTALAPYSKFKERAEPAMRVKNVHVYAC